MAKQAALPTDTAEKADDNTSEKPTDDKTEPTEK